MRIGIPGEIKPQEDRIALVPGGAAEFIKRGHTVVMTTGAAQGIGLTDEDYKAVGVEILPTIDHTANQVESSLKYSDPDEYIRQTLEAQRANPYDQAFDTASQQAADEAGRFTVEGEIAAYNANNPDKKITLDMLELDVPPRLVNDFSQGKIDPQDFLTQAADILYRPTETHNEHIPVTPDLGDVGGQTSPTDDGSNDKMLANYASAIF